MNRSQYAAKNIAFGYLSNIVVTILGFVLRTIFIYKLDKALLGINSLYTDILSVLSLADLGLGTAMNYSLYAPVAKKDYQKIVAYMHMFKKAYRYIALVVAGLGALLIPFLQYIIKDVGVISLNQLRLYYIIFLVNTVSTYLVSYKYSLVNAEQKGYIQTNITMLTKLVTVALQIGALLIWGNFTIYLFMQMMVELIQKIIVNIYLNHKYPYLKEAVSERLSIEEKKDVTQNVKALCLHKIGDIARFQTDSIIISAFIGVELVGMVDNYKLVITSISGFVNIIFNSVLASLGNLIATESREKQYQVFKAYRLLGSWIYGFSAVGFFVLLTPLIKLLWGEEFVIGISAISLLLADYYFKGFRIILTNFKTAAGIFQEDKYIALIQGIVNLIISLALVQQFGLVGIYIGTVVSGLIANFVKPYIIYRKCFERSIRDYYGDSAKYTVLSMTILGIAVFINTNVVRSDTWTGFIVMVAIITILYNGGFLLFFHKKEEFKYLLNRIEQSLLRKEHRSSGEVKREC